MKLQYSISLLIFYYISEQNGNNLIFPSMEDLIGKKIDNHSIISLLGRGGMGVVYKAHDETLDRFVAIKILSSHVLVNYLSEVESKYFIRRNKDPKRVKIFSIISTALVVILMMALKYFVYIQVGELLRSGTLDKFEKYNIAYLFDSDSELNFKKIKVLKSGTNYNLNSIFFADDNMGLAVGDSTKIILTIDSGKTWEPIENIKSAKYNDVYFNDNGNAYIVGENSTFLVSDDYFENAYNMNFEKGFNLHRILFTDRFTG